jgi:hypothetical protein
MVRYSIVCRARPLSHVPSDTCSAQHVGTTEFPSSPIATCERGNHIIRSSSTSLALQQPTSYTSIARLRPPTYVSLVGRPCRLTRTHARTSKPVALLRLSAVTTTIAQTASVLSSQRGKAFREPSRNRIIMRSSKWSGFAT